MADQDPDVYELLAASLPDTGSVEQVENGYRWTFTSPPIIRQPHNYVEYDRYNRSLVIKPQHELPETTTLIESILQMRGKKS